MKQIFYCYIITICSILFVACELEKTNEYLLPEPLIVVSNPVPCIGEEVTFYYQTELSASPTWTLNGARLSTDAILKHRFFEEGNYSINLELSDGKGGKVSVSQTVEVMGGSLVEMLKTLLETPSKIWICSHRANTYEGVKSANIPENSIEAIQKAIEKGVEMVEIDVRTTYDGHFVLMHDETINRTTNGQGYVQNKTLKEIKALKMKDSNKMLTDCIVPTLKEALLAGRGKVFFNLDIAGKPNDVQKMMQLVDSLHMTDRVCFYTGSDKEMAGDLLAANKMAIIFPWVSSNTNIDYFGTNDRIKMVQLNYALSSSSSLISYARQKGMISFSNALNDIDNAVLANDFSEIDKMKSVQLQMIQTDYAELIKNHLNK